MSAGFRKSSGSVRFGPEFRKKMEPEIKMTENCPDANLELPLDWPCYDDIRTVYGTKQDLCRCIAVLNERMRRWNVID